MITKGTLAIALSKLSGFSSPSLSREQYVSDPEIAAEVLWQAYLLGDMEFKRVADLGCGPGMLGIGSAYLRCKELTFVDSDEYALSLASMQYSKLELEGIAPKAVFENCDIKDFNGTADVVVMNPPFGTRMRHADMHFLEKAFEVAPVTYSFHKTSTKGYLRRLAEKNGKRITHEWDFQFPIKATQSHHTRRIHRIDVSALRFS